MKKAISITIPLILALCCGVGGFFIGRTTAPQTEITSVSVASSTSKTYDNSRVYVINATILDIYDSGLHIQGLEVNDINSRGEFTVGIDETVMLEQNGMKLQIEDLQVGDTIEVFHAGYIAECYPAIVEQPIRIELLEKVSANDE